MKKLIPTKSAPWLILAGGILGLALRKLMHALFLDVHGLLEAGNPLALASWILTALTAVFLAVWVFPLDGSNLYEDNFSPSIPAALGSFLAAGGILATVLGANPFPQDRLTLIWRVLGILAALGLAGAGLCRLKGKCPFVLFHAAVCIFFAAHLINGYRVWSGKPLIRDYTFQIFACLGLMLASYQHTAFEAGLGQRRALLFTSLLAVFLCCPALNNADTPLLYLGCGIWLFTSLCRLEPLPRRKSSPEAPAQAQADSSSQPPNEESPDREVT